MAQSELNLLEQQMHDLTQQREAFGIIQNDASAIRAMIAAERIAWETMDDEELYRSRSRVHTAYRRFIDFINFNGRERTVTVIIQNGIRAYRFRNGQLIDHFNDETIHMRVGPSPLTATHFASPSYDRDGNMTNEPEFNERMSAIELLIRAGKN